jgi:hypothetical protein
MEGVCGAALRRPSLTSEPSPAPCPTPSPPPPRPHPLTPPSYHNDAADIVTLLCLKNARAGGLSSWSSSISVHNEILRRRPDLGPVLSGPWCAARGAPPPLAAAAARRPAAACSCLRRPPALLASALPPP